jgi:CubicO group peptidase (beta-lactamase class C family)
MVNVASVGKMFATIAVLQSLARHHLSIDSRVWPFLPPDWVKGPGTGTITFAELLTHRAGFRLDSGLVFQTGNAAREQISHGIQQIDKQAADYNNINFTIFRDLLPFMEGARDQGPAADRFFLAYVRRQVFDPMGVTGARCAPVRHAMLVAENPESGPMAVAGGNLLPGATEMPSGAPCAPLSSDKRCATDLRQMCDRFQRTRAAGHRVWTHGSADDDMGG